MLDIDPSKHYIKIPLARRLLKLLRCEEYTNVQIIMDELYAIELRLASFETGIFCKRWGQLEIGECRSGGICQD